MTHLGAFEKGNNTTRVQRREANASAQSLKSLMRMLENTNNAYLNDPERKILWK